MHAEPFSAATESGMGKLTRTKTEKNRDKRKRQKDRHMKPGVARAVSLIAVAESLAELTRVQESFEQVLERDLRK